MEITCKEQYVSLIASGKKKIEGRLNKGRFVDLKKGDTVFWYSGKNVAKTKIVSINKYSTFIDMLIAEGVKNVLPDIELNNGKTTLYKGMSVYRQFYSQEDETEYGVLAIAVDVVD